MKFPEQYAALTENEKMNTIGGGAAETAVKAVVAIGGAAALTGVAAVAARGILSIFNPNRNWESIIAGSIEGGKNFIEGSMNAGRDFLNRLMGIELL